MTIFSRAASLWRSLTLRSGAAWRAYYGGGSAAGKTVTPESAMTVAAAWSCIRLLSQTVATLPLGVYEGLGADRKPAEDYWLADILSRSPNADQTPVEFFEGVLGCLALRGNFFARKAMMNEAGRFVSLETMFPDSTTMRREGGSVVFDWVDPDGKKYTLPEREVLHIKGFGIGGDLGLSPIAFARQTLGASMAADESAAKVFANGLQPSGFLEVAQELDKDQRAELNKVMSEYVGSTNVGKLMILEAGMKFNPLSMKPEEAQLLLTRRFNVEEVCRWFGIPPILIGHAADGQTMWGSGVEQIMIAWLTLGLRPYLVRIEQAIVKRAMPAADRAKFKPEFNVEGLLRADSQGRAALYSALAQNGLRTRNELRRLDNAPPVDGGDDLTVQSNLVRLQDLGAIVANGGGQSQQVREAFRSWLGVQDLPPLPRAA